MKLNKTGIVIGILVLIILILIGIVCYLFFFKPALTGYVAEKQMQGFEYAIFSIMNEASKCQPVPLYAGNETINVVAVECLQQQSSG